ncbi:MAG TPA: sigma-70 family RNA polymerase sigma factor [Solirubrobacteraceae bacterium]|jgi:RNA polymerase sigma-70 factor (ECF subfamily)
MNRGQSDFARVYDEHLWQIYGFLAYQIGDRHLAEDLTQATFERALRDWSRFDPRRATERTWLLAIARNLLIDQHRKDRHRRTEETNEERTPTGLGPEEQIGAAAELTEALTKLSERDREVLALHYGAGLTGAEISQLLGLSPADVQQITSRALRKLRELLAPTAGSVAQSSHGSQSREQDQA